MSKTEQDAEKNPKGVAIDPTFVAKVRVQLTKVGVDEDDWKRFLATVIDVVPGQPAPGVPLTKDQFALIRILDNASRDKRIERCFHHYSEKYDTYKSGLTRDIFRLMKVADKMGQYNFLNIDAYWAPLVSVIPANFGKDPYLAYLVNKKDPKWESTPDPSVTVSPMVIKKGKVKGVPEPAAPAPKAPVKAPAKAKPKKAPAPAPIPATPPVSFSGGCMEGMDTHLKELNNDLVGFNTTQGHKWTGGQSVKVQSLSMTGVGETTAVIINENGDIAAVPVTLLTCFDMPPAAVPAPPPVAPPTPPPPPEPAVIPKEEPAVEVAIPPTLVPPVLTQEQESLGARFAALFREVKNRFLFSQKFDGVVFGSTMLIQNGSCLLKGAPGTGKTTLLQLAAMMVSGKDGPEGKDWRDDLEKIKRVDDLFEWMKVNQYFGMTQYNADKEPEDIFFKTDISIVSEEKSDGKETDRYHFAPTAREIVTSFIKLHNESNRLGPNTADALLGLLAERRVEYKGQYFSSPARKEWKGHLNYFDYNPHLDTEGFEMDRALLDRIDIGIYLPGGSLNTRYEVLKKRVQMKALGLPEDLMEALRRKDGQGNYVLNPLTPSDIIKLWDIAQTIPIDDEALRWITFFTNLGNMTVRVYKDGTYYDTDESSGFPEPKAMSNTYIDPTVMSYKGSKDQMTLKEIPQPMGTGGSYFPIMSTIDAFNRPLGSRAALSFINLVKAETLFRYMLAPDKSKVQLAFIVNQRKMNKNGKYMPETPAQTKVRMVQITKLLDFLPYVLDHRINIGVGRDIQTNFLNFAHYLRYYFRSQVFFNKEKKYYDEWMDASTLINELTSTSIADRRLEWVTKFMEKRNIGGGAETYIKGEMRNDPFRMQWYDLAGAK